MLAGPFDLATLHLPAQVFLSVMVLGGVLSRHPGLAVGVMELGAAWVPSWVAGLDQAATGFRRFGLPLPSELPSEAVRRQVRVSPFNLEPVADYLQSGLPEVFAFSTDYPHSEGGRDPVTRLTTALEPLGTDALDQFFVTNGSRLLPAA
jgi:predicted TIM-barrel fold metal-dependent hydrolase